MVTSHPSRCLRWSGRCVRSNGSRCSQMWVGDQTGHERLWRTTDRRGDGLVTPPSKGVGEQ